MSNSTLTEANSSYDTYSKPSSFFKTKSDIGLNEPSEVAKQLLYLLEVIPLIVYSVLAA
nr:MAG TPA: hypothetical protein [Bacteriophage sp.]